MGERTSREWGDYIMAAIDAAKADGFTVEMFDNNSCRCCGGDFSLDIYKQIEHNPWHDLTELRF